MNKTIPIETRWSEIDARIELFNKIQEIEDYGASNLNDVIIEIHDYLHEHYSQLLPTTVPYFGAD